MEVDGVSVYIESDEVNELVDAIYKADDSLQDGEDDE
jgi:hypothetical protein